jgi:inosose dehydratase
MNRRLFFSSGLLLTLAFVFASFLLSNDSPKPKVKWGIALITWGAEYEKGLEESAGFGVKGVQIRKNVFDAYKAKPAEFKIKLKKLGIKAPVLSGGNIDGDPAKRQAQVQQFVEMAQFVKSIGGEYLQATTRERDAYPPGKDKLLQLAEAINEIGKAVKETGVKLLLHNHMHQFCETPEELKILMDNTNPEWVGLLLDVAHFAQGGGNPSEAIKTYKKRLQLLHIKDVISPKTNHQGPQKYNYQFVELGKGNQIQWKPLMASLKEVGFKGWCLIELDAVPDPKSNPKEATQVSLDFLSREFGYQFEKK